MIKGLLGKLKGKKKPERAWWADMPVKANWKSIWQGSYMPPEEYEKTLIEERDKMRLARMNEICDIRDKLKHLDLTVEPISDPEYFVWGLKVYAKATVEGAHYSVVRQTPWWDEEKTFTNEEWEREIDSLATVISVAMGRNVFGR